jgi:ornithine racemase
MAYLTLNRDKFKDNFNFLKEMFEENDVSWGVVSKLLCGNRLFLKELIDLGVEEIHDSRISNLAKIKEINPDIQTVYIKPVSKRNVSKMVRYADVSLNSELTTIQWISEESVKQNKIHKIIIMVETGDLREGVMGDHLIDFYAGIFELPNIEVIGWGQTSIALMVSCLPLINSFSSLYINRLLN